MKKLLEIEVEITTEELVHGLIDLLAPHAKTASWRDSTLWVALAWMVGISAESAVAVANHEACAQDWPIITVEEFRQWLPERLSAVLAQALPEAAAEARKRIAGFAAEETP